MTRRADQLRQRDPRLRRQRRAPAPARHDDVDVRTRVHGIDVSTVTTVDEEEARARIAVLAGVEPPVDVRPELMVLPLDTERPESPTPYRLVWRMRVTSRRDIVQYFVDASTGAVVLQVQRSSVAERCRTRARRARGQQEDQRVRKRQPVHGAGPAPAASHHHIRHERRPRSDGRLSRGTSAAHRRRHRVG